MMELAGVQPSNRHRRFANGRSSSAGSDGLIDIGANTSGITFATA